MSANSVLAPQDGITRPDSSEYLAGVGRNELSECHSRSPSLKNHTRSSSDMILPLDPATNTVTSFHAPVRDSEMPLSLGDGHAATLEPVMPSAYWGDPQIWDTRVNNHNPPEHG